MDIKKRLIFSNTITAIIPIIFTIIITFSIVFISSVFFNKSMSVDNFKKLVNLKSELLDTSNSILKQNPDAMEHVEYQQYLAGRLSSFNGEIVIVKNDNVIFSSANISEIDIEKCLQNGEEKLNKAITINKKVYVSQIIPLSFSNGVKGDAILLAPVSDAQNDFEKLIIYVVLIFIFIFIITNIFMSYLFSKRIIKPVSILKHAASEISNGNLDCEIIEDGDQEIKELCSDFEKMRVQLKDSVLLRMKYDDDRKMLVSSISHDLKTPITSIKGYVEGILDGVANTPEKLDEYLKTIYSKAKLMDGMIDDLLLYSKLDLNQVPFKYENTNIIEYFEYCVFESAPELKKYNIEINLCNELKDSKYVKIDRERIRRVIMNIIDNSRKYMDKQQGKISINLRETNLSIIIEIRDNGSGISEEDVNKVFDRFYRCDTARSEIKGSGLGLAIAKQIVEGHKGKIWAISHGNEGTSILISLAKTV